MGLKVHLDLTLSNFLLCPPPALGEVVLSSNVIAEGLLEHTSSTFSLLGLKVHLELASSNLVSSTPPAYKGVVN